MESLLDCYFFIFFFKFTNRCCFPEAVGVAAPRTMRGLTYYFTNCYHAIYNISFFILQIKGYGIARRQYKLLHPFQNVDHFSSSKIFAMYLEQDVYLGA